MSKEDTQHPITEFIKNDHKVRHIIFTWNKKFLFFSLLAIVLFIVSATTLTLTLNYESKKQINKLSFDEKMKRYKDNWMHFKNNVSGKEMIAKWSDLFYDINYVKAGDYKFKSSDCLGGIFKFYNSYGANIAIETVQAMHARIRMLNRLGKCQIRKNFNEIKIGDIIIMNVNGTGHVAVVVSKRKGILLYADVNAKMMGMGFNMIHYKHSWIKDISEVSFWFWIGNEFKN